MKQQKKNFIALNEGFECQHCGIFNPPLSPGYRNHCRECLYSLHVDKELPGDRASECMGLMVPVGLDRRPGRGDVIVHLCAKCDKKIVNKIAADDNYDKIIEISTLR